MFQPPPIALRITLTVLFSNLAIVDKMHCHRNSAIPKRTGRPWGWIRLREWRTAIGESSGRFTCKRGRANHSLQVECKLHSVQRKSDRSYGHQNMWQPQSEVRTLQLVGSHQLAFRTVGRDIFELDQGQFSMIDGRHVPVPSTRMIYSKSIYKASEYDN